ncbi:MAG: hypothetical protein HY331_00430 [Chloroflexi bacterium]|nr:hypothetical protein [Chloroflexota bacterium]
MRQLIRRLIREQWGAESLEYVLVGSLVALGTLVGATTFTSSLQDLFNRVVIIVDSSIPVV